jgi:hypothetical protein
VPPSRLMAGLGGDIRNSSSASCNCHYGGNDSTEVASLTGRVRKYSAKTFYDAMPCDPKPVYTIDLGEAESQFGGLAYMLLLISDIWA